MRVQELDYYCNECGRKINWRGGRYGSGICRSCSKTGKRNPRHGIRYAKKYYCSECGNRITLQGVLYGSGLCKSCCRKGEKTHLYIDGRTPMTKRIRHLEKYRKWIVNVFERDDYTCQFCGIRNGKGKTVFLEAHHIIPFSCIYKTFIKEYNKYSPQEDKDILIKLAEKWSLFWDVNNGMTLCKECHNYTKISISNSKWNKRLY